MYRVQHQQWWVRVYTGTYNRLQVAIHVILKGHKVVIQHIHIILVIQLLSNPFFQPNANDQKTAFHEQSQKWQQLARVLFSFSVEINVIGVSTVCNRV